MKITREHRQTLHDIVRESALTSSQKISAFLAAPVDFASSHVEVMGSADLAMTLQALDSPSVVASQQGFYGDRVRGETVTLIHEADPKILAMLTMDDSHSDVSDLANVLNGVFLTCVGEQMDVNFVTRVPRLIGSVEPFHPNPQNTTSTLVVECAVQFADSSMRCDLLIMLDQTSLDTILKKINYLVE